VAVKMSYRIAIQYVTPMKGEEHSVTWQGIAKSYDDAYTLATTWLKRHRRVAKILGGHQMGFPIYEITREEGRVAAEYLRKLLHCPDLNMEDLEPETVELIEEVQVWLKNHTGSM